MNYINLTYSYINKLIKSEKLIELLTNIETTNYTEKEKEQLKEIINELTETIKNVPNEIDYIEEFYQKMLDSNIEYLEKVKHENEELEQYYNSLIEQKKEIRDCGPRYEKVSELLEKSELFQELYNKLNNSERLELLTKYLNSPKLPKITQEKINELVQTGIQEDKREALWRLAYNYRNCNMDYNTIIDFYIKARDIYYIIEIVCAVEEEINKNELIEKIFATEDKKFIIDCTEEIQRFELLNEEQILMLKEREQK